MFRSRYARQESRREQLFTYYCICGEYCLITDTHLYMMNTRQTDNAAILNKNKVTHRLNVDDNRVVVHVKRWCSWYTFWELRVWDCVAMASEGGYERQSRMFCPRCGLWVAYEPNDRSQYLYLVDGALLRNQSDAQSILQLEEQRRKEASAAYALQQASEENPHEFAQVTASIIAELTAPKPSGGVSGSPALPASSSPAVPASESTATGGGSSSAAT